MNILITNHHLQDFAGTENSTFTLAKYLKKNHHQVTIYSKFVVDKLVDKFKKIGVPVCTDLTDIKNQQFDIGHIQHNICAYEVRYHFPNLPLIMWVHGVIPFLEQPPFIDLNISQFLVNNLGALDHLVKLGIPKHKITIFRNIVDTDLFFPTKPINRIVKNALIISNKITPDKELFLRQILDKLNIKSVFVGRRFKTIDHSQIPKFINNADIVFTLGLGAMESMFCGRIPIVFDNQLTSGNDGMVTSSNFKTIMEHNFSGRAIAKVYTKQDLINEIRLYDHRQGEILRELSLSFYDANTQVTKIIEIYQNTINSFHSLPLKPEKQNILYHLINIITETKHQCYYNTLRTNTKSLAKLEENTINYITSSKFYKLWQLYTKIKIALHR